VHRRNRDFVDRNLRSVHWNVIFHLQVACSSSIDEMIRKSHDNLFDGCCMGCIAMAMELVESQNQIKGVFSFDTFKCVNTELNLICQ
jgi:hypothetical protein